MASSFGDVVSTGFMPHGMCYLWRPDLLALHVVSDALIALAYLAIPITLVYFVRRRTDVQFNWMFLCFSAFIAACGLSHLMDIWTVWHPAYWLSGGVKALTALASVLTSILLIKFVPYALRLPRASALRESHAALEREISERIRAEDNLLQVNATLEARVADRTAQLADLNRTLTRDNERFAIAADAAGLGFWSLDVETDLLQWDERTSQLYGRSPATGEKPFTAWTRCLHPEDRANFEQDSADALSGTRPFDTEFRVLHPNGTLRHLKSAARITRDTDGRAVQMYGVTVDITELKRADEKFHRAIEAAPTAMLMMDRAGMIVLVNAQVEKLFGYRRDELLGRQIEMLVPDRLREHHPVLRISFFDDPKTRAMGGGRELFGLSKDGREVPIEIGLNPLHTTEGDFVLGSIIDLSQRREMDRMRSDFVSTVSHELRTPLTSISGSLGLLQSGAMGALSEKVAAMVRIAHKNSERLVRIINDILDIGKLEAGQLAVHLVSISLGELLRQSVEVNSAYAEKYEVRFLIDGGCAEDRVMADPDRLMQVLTNLLSNAAKFSPPGADVLIRVLPGYSTLRIEVEDSGPGIPVAFQAHVFEKFAQADASPSRRYEGTGLGLSIARKLVETMDGSIGFTTVVGQGTIFHVELPRTDATSTGLRKVLLSDTAAHRMLLAAAEPVVSAAHTPAPRLLFVEDDEDLISVIGATLVNKAQIVSAHSLREAEQLLREERFDLVILDQTLPDGDGLSLVDRIPGLVERIVPNVILLVVDPPRDIHSKVAAVLMKSKVSAAQAAATILSYLPAARR
jgi:PAS domain S-box-containing protein